MKGYDALNTSFTAEPLATFDLTPATGSDGMVFNLTPVKSEQPPSSAAAALVSPVPAGYDLNSYSRQLSFGPPPATPTLPTQVVTRAAPPPALTPDFTGDQSFKLGVQHLISRY